MINACSSAVKKGLKGNFLTLHFLPKWTDDTQWRNAKQTFVNVKKTHNIIEIMF